MIIVVVDSATQAWMPEWSKGADLRPAVFARVGSNPTPSISTCSSVG